MTYDSAEPAIVEADRAWSIEQHAIEPIPASDRHGSPFELLKMWLGANINYVVVVTGSLTYSLGLSVWQAVLAILLGNVMGCTLLGFSSVMGPKTGSAGIMSSRASFGQLGAVLPVAISLVSALSWFSIQSVVATESLEAIFHSAGLTGSWIVWAALVIVLVAEIALAVFGHATIIAAERWIAVVLAALFAGLAIFAVEHLQTAQITLHPDASWSTWMGAMSLVVAFPIGWANFASDYSRYLPAQTSWKRIALCAGGGQFIALVFCELIGLLFAVGLNGALGNDPIHALGGILPGWFIVPFLFAVILGGVAANVPNGYTAALGMLALRIPIKRVASLAVIAVFTLIVRIITVYYGSFYDLYEAFLGYLVFWTTPWAAIVVVDYFLRAGRYSGDDLMRWGSGSYWYQSGVFWPGLVAFLLGVGASVASSYSDTFHSPFAAQWLGSADLSIEVGFVVPALVYFFMARRRLAGCVS
jgi:nucleobase:cation symporter-1, NCS1 family